MIDKIFVFQSTRDRQREAPLLQEREAFLAYLYRQQIPLKRLRSIASMLLHIMRLLDLKTPRTLSPFEIRQAAHLWLSDPHQVRSRRPKSEQSFHSLSTRWFKFALLISSKTTVKNAHEILLDDFREYLTATRGLSPLGVRNICVRSAYFLSWVYLQQIDVRTMSLMDVERFLHTRAVKGDKPRTIESICSALRQLFRYLELRGIGNGRIAPKIVGPRINRYDSQPRGPAWTDVRRLLDHNFGSTAFNIRADAIVSLCAIYALRRCELSALTLDDLDWQNETIRLKRAKSQRLQYLPFKYEVGETILRYLRHVRPRCVCRRLFVTIRPPFRPIASSSIWSIISNRLRALGIESENRGSHALRHSCATYLLRSGSSLKDVADFLGHSDLKSVTIYARHDLKSLSEVANFSLAGVI